MTKREWMVWGAMAGTFVAYQALDIACMRGLFVTVPHDRDPRLVGRWRGVWLSMFPHIGELVFQADGTIHVKDGKYAYPFPRGQWGTRGGVLYLKFLATDVWARTEARYAVAGDGRLVTLSPRRNHWLPNGMRRLERHA